MHCPLCCSKAQVWVVESRARKDGSWRRRQECRRCRVRWTSHETVVSGPDPLTPPQPVAELPPDVPHCSRCQQWQPRQQRCGLEFPEAQFELDFASTCLHYQAAAAA